MRTFPVPTLRAAALAVAALVAVAGCSSGSNAGATTAASAAAPPAAASAPAGGTAAVAIKGFAFNPATFQAKVGESITWTNQDGDPHTVTLDDKSVDSGSLAQNATYSHAFLAAGSYPYHCEIHNQMVGTITVRG
jgi:plastocyanin